MQAKYYIEWYDIAYEQHLECVVILCVLHNDNTVHNLRCKLILSLCHWYSRPVLATVL